MYAPTYETLKHQLQDSLNRNLSLKGWTLKTLSDRSGVPYETLKKLANAKIDNPSLQSVIKVAQAFDCTLDSLFVAESDLAHKLLSLPARSREFVEAIADLELAMTTRERKPEACMVPVIIPTGNMSDGMIYDSLCTEYLDASPYLTRFGTHLMCALKITDNSFFPTYMDGDLLLIARDRLPRYGSICIFLHDNQLFIRKFVPGTPARLDSVNNRERSVYIEDPESWMLFGSVLTVVRKPPHG